MVKKICAVFALLLPLCLWAQTDEINNIKEQPDKYLYAEATAATYDEALGNAIFLFDMEVENWASDMGKIFFDTYLERAQENMKDIQSMRGDRYRAFVYVSKKDVMPEEYGDAQEESQYYEIEEAEEEKEKVETADNEQNDSFGPIYAEEQEEVSEPEPVKEVRYTPDSFEKEMMQVTAATQIGGFILGKQKSGKIDRYGKYADMPQNGNAYLFVYNREQKVAAYLKKTGRDYLNLKTGKQDDVRNYKGCGAYWFTIK